MLSLNSINLKVRMKELKIALQNIDIEEARTDHINLIMKYTLNRKLYENQMSQDEADRIELRINNLSKRNKKYESTAITGNRIIFSISMSLINALRFIMNKNSIIDISSDFFNSPLVMAYFYERNYHLEKALQYYEEGLKSSKLSRSLTAGVILHQGYCYALLSQYKKAKNKYREVISNYKNEDISITATVLLEYLNGFVREQQKIIQSEKDSLEKGEKLFRLMAYKKSTAILKKIIPYASEAEKGKIFYLLARSNEEMGNTEAAVKKYMELILLSPNSSYAVNANRRMYLIGDNSHNEAVKNFAVKLSRNIFNDRLLNESVRSDVADVPSESRIRMKVNFNLTKLESLYALKSGKRKNSIISKKVRIVTTDGNTFVGRIIKIEQQKYHIKTSIGDIEINKKKISGLKIIR